MAIPCAAIKRDSVSLGTPTASSLQRGMTTPNECPVYDIKQSDGVAPVMQELWGIRSTSSLPSLPDPLLPRVGALDKILSMGQIEENCALMQN